MASSAMRLKLGVFWFADQHTETHANKMNPQSSRRVAFHTLIFTLRPQYISTWQITVILIVGKTRIPQIWVPCQDKNGAGSGISFVCLWHNHISLTLGRQMDYIISGRNHLYLILLVKCSSQNSPTIEKTINWYSPAKWLHNPAVTWSRYFCHTTVSHWFCVAISSIIVQDSKAWSGRPGNGGLQCNTLLTKQ